MTQVKFSGPATISGFPRDKGFSFELDGQDRFILKAGKDVFLIVERELPQTSEAPPAYLGAAVPGGAHLEKPFIRPEAVTGAIPESGTAQASHSPTPQPTDSGEEKKSRKPRSPSISINDNDVITVDLNKENPYAKLRGKYYDTLKTAHGRTVSWWENSAMVKALEGSPRTLLRFFLTEGVVKLVPAVASQEPPKESLQQSSQFAAPIVPGFGQQPVAGPTWSPPGGSPQPGGAKFL